MSSTVNSVFITGANRGIGLQFVKDIADKFKPKHLFATFRNAEQAKELHELAAKNPAIHLVQLDIADVAKYDEVVRKVDEVTGGAGLNLLINNSGILNGAKASLANLELEDFTQHFVVNSIAPILLTRAFIPLLKKAADANSRKSFEIGKAAVVNISTLIGSITDNTSGGYYPYRMSKVALNMGTKSLSIELKKENILITMIHPGWVQTDMGGKNATLTVPQSVSSMVGVLESLNESYNGKFLNYDGKELPW